MEQITVKRNGKEITYNVIPKDDYHRANKEIALKMKDVIIMNQSAQASSKRLMKNLIINC
jgi:hypothetical protein